MPFLYSTNGEVIWFHDVRHELNRSRRVEASTRQRRSKKCSRRDFDAALADWRDSAEDHPRTRGPTRVEANTAIERRSRRASGRCSWRWPPAPARPSRLVNEVYRLMKSGVATRVLFLVDRRALAAQAVRAFASFEPEPGQKFDKIYEVYSQRFQPDDFDEDEKFDPKVLPNDVPHRSASRATPSSTSARSSAWRSTCSAARPSRGR